MTFNSNCPICNNNEFRNIDDIRFGYWKDLGQVELERVEDNLKLGECLECGHVKIISEYSNELLQAIYGGESEGNIYWGKGVEDPLLPYHKMVEYCDFSEQKTSQYNIVDLGCGNGTLLNVLHNDFGFRINQIIGMDFKNYMNEKYNFEMLSLNEEESIVKNSSLEKADFLFCSHVLEHVNNPFETLNAVYKKLKNGAKIYIEVPDNSSLLKCNSGNVHLINQQHIQYFTMSNLIRMSERCGYEVIKAQKIVSGELPRLMILLEKNTLVNQNQTVLSLREIRKRRTKVASMILEEIKENREVGIWGIGADFTKIVKDNAEIQKIINSNLLSFFDYNLKGKKFMGKMIKDSAEIKSFEGNVYITPMIRKAREGMIRIAEKEDFSNGKVIDPYE